jgi:hypothetical protein
MIEVISFRLNPENHREAIALQVLKRRMAEGCSIRQIITEALIKSEDQKQERDYNNDEIDLQATLKEITSILHQLQVLNDKKLEPDMRSVEQDCLADSFISSMKLSVKSGMKAC